jgi:hypothetical protein
MELAIKEIQDRINCYDYWVRDCHPYFKETKEQYQVRINTLKNTLDQLKRVLSLISNEESNCKIPNILFSDERADICKRNDHWKECVTWTNDHRCIKSCDLHK